MTLTKLRRRIRAAHRRFRDARLVGLAFKSDRHAVLVHVVPIRRCNLLCAYCNEFDKHSKPVPLDEMLRSPNARLFKSAAMRALRIGR